MIDPVIRDDDIVTVAGTAAAEPAINALTGEQIDSYAIVRAGDDAESIVEGEGMNSLVLFDGVDGVIEIPDSIDLVNGQTMIGGGSVLAAHRSQLRRHGESHAARRPTTPQQRYDHEPDVCCSRWHDWFELCGS